MKVINLSQTNSILNEFIIQIRDKVIQKDSMRFRRNLSRIGEVFAYEISKTLTYKDVETQTPLGISYSQAIQDKIVIASILRAALPLHDGFLNFFDAAQNSFVAAYRKYGKDNKFEIQIEYASAPSMDGKTLILVDPMLATGASIVLTYDKLCSEEKPAISHIVCPIASQSGVDYIKKHLPHENITLWVGAIDEELTNKSYIVPGLGDAGDLAFGQKL